MPFSIRHYCLLPAATPITPIPAAIDIFIDVYFEPLAIISPLLIQIIDMIDISLRFRRWIRRHADAAIIRHSIFHFRFRRFHAISPPSMFDCLFSHDFTDRQVYKEK
jgi:hypothetical protein